MVSHLISGTILHLTFPTETKVLTITNSKTKAILVHKTILSRILGLTSIAVGLVVLPETCKTNQHIPTIVEIRIKQEVLS